MRHKIKIQHKPILAIDFDLTFHFGNRYPFIGEPNKPLIDFLIEHRNEFYLILNTCRHDKQLEYAKEWLKEQGLIFDCYNENAPWLIAEYGDCRKIFADYYIDSNAYTPEAFLKMMGS